MTNINEKISNRLRIATINLQNSAQDKLNKFSNLTRQQAITLRIINSSPGMIQKTLADKLNRKTASVSSILKNLEKNGFILRKQAPDNDRNKHLYLTNTGKKELNNLLNNLNDIWDSTNNGLNHSEKKQLIILLDKLIGGFQD